MNRARQAKAVLDPSVGAPILDPLLEGRVRGLSYAVLPYCDVVSESRLGWWVQRSLLRPAIFDWLRRVTERTAREVEPAAIARSFSEPLRHIAALELVSSRFRVAAEQAAERLAGGIWKPRHVLMHGDLWKGNILIRTAKFSPRRWRWRDRFVVIDWAGSEVYGYAIYDLVRLADSMRLGAGHLRRELEQHCHLLQCERPDAMSYLLAALGRISMNLEHFPTDRYSYMAESCLTILEQTFV